MKRSGFGYCTDVRYDNLGNVGIMEKYNFLRNFNNQECKLLFCVDTNGIPVMPAYMDVDNGFVPLATKIEPTTEGLNKFLRSHKGCFDILGSFLFIVEASLKYNVYSKELVDSRIQLFLPVQVMESVAGYYDTRGNLTPVIISQLCSSQDSTFTRETNAKVLELYESKILEFLTYDRILNREAYMKARLGID